MERNDAASSVLHSQGVEGRKKRNCQGGIDLISSLPDSLIHHILSFLPSTKDSIKTSILSKRWQFQWTGVPTLLFDSDKMTRETFFKSIDRTLISHDCSKIVKFLIETDNHPSISPDTVLAVWIRFATRKEVKELILNLSGGAWLLPQFLFNNDSLIQLKTRSCDLIGNGKVSWRSLKHLHIDFAALPDGTIENVISGSPLLESLELVKVYGFHLVVIASNSLKRLVLENIYGDEIVGSVLEISCPNLALLNFSQTLYISRFELRNLPSSVCVSLDFDLHIEEEENIMVIAEKLVEEILKPVEHVLELHIGQWLLSVLSVLEAVKGSSSLLLKCKCLTLEVHSFHRTLPGIACLLRNSPELGELYIEGQKQYNGFKMPEEILSSYKFGQDYWKSHNIVFICLVSHLKTVDIIRFPEDCDEYPLMITFVEFLLKNARVLEEIVILQKNRQRLKFSLGICKKLLSAPRCSARAVVNFI